MGLYSGGLIIGRISASEIWGLILVRAYLIYFFSGEGELLSEFYGILTRATSSYLRKKVGFSRASQRKTPTVQKTRVMKTQKAARQSQIKKSKS